MVISQATAGLPVSSSETASADSGDDTAPDSRFQTAQSCAVTANGAPTAAGTVNQQRNAIVLREPQISDGPHLYQLVRNCPPLDLNSLYSYLLLCEHHPSTCVVAEVNGEVQGFVSAYMRPDQPDVIFVWQVAVHESARGMGLAQGMLLALLERESTRTARFLETTVGPGNVSSRRMFRAVADHHGAEIQERLLFGAELFGSGEHEDECLLRIGPIKTNYNQGKKS
ncbi:MAG TPA: diaminobutyrate acetyltransferase [Burkholderiaceae bacterium]|nr:diaminobutyrate acetyltransferase [Burkholderiaceae bacterium]